MAGCALLCVGQKLRMMDELGNLRVTEAMELLKANEAGNLILFPLLFSWVFIFVDYLKNNIQFEPARLKFCEYII